jgi:Leucine-rich repeat (LRR) protein
MKKLLLILLCVPLIGVGQTLIPDAYFEQALINLGYDTPPINGSVLTVNINTVTYLDIMSYNIADLTGIEDFTSLIELWCSYNQLTSLDVSNNTALSDLRCYNNLLTSLDVSNNTALTILSCGGNQLTSLDVSQNTALGTLGCGGNQLTSLDVSQNTALSALGCDGNQLTSLDVSNNYSLSDISLCENPLTFLDISNTAVDGTIDPASNRLPLLDCGATYQYNLTEYRANNVMGLIEFYWWNKDYLKIEFLNISNNPNLEAVLANGSNSIVNLDVSQNPVLRDLQVSENQITNLDVSNIPSIETLNCSQNQLTLLNLDNLNYFNLDLNTTSNPALLCIQVSDSLIATNALSSGIDSWSYFSEDCNYVSGIEEFSTNKELLKVTDILGREVNEKRNTPLFYIYNDGTVEKKIIIE